MSNDIELIQPSPDSRVTREIAALLSTAGDREIYVEAIGKKMPAKEYLAMMVWDLLTVGQAITAEGAILEMEKISDWLVLMKFVSGHLDGIAGRDAGVTANIFKIYVGVDVGRV